MNAHPNRCLPNPACIRFCNKTADASAQTFVLLSLRTESASRLSPTKHFTSLDEFLLSANTPHVSLSKPLSINENIASLWHLQHRHLSVCHLKHRQNLPSLCQTKTSRLSLKWKHITSLAQPEPYFSLSAKTLHVSCQIKTITLSLPSKNLSRLAAKQRNTSRLCVNQNISRAFIHASLSKYPKHLTRICLKTETPDVNSHRPRTRSKSENNLQLLRLATCHIKERFCAVLNRQIWWLRLATCHIKTRFRSILNHQI